jgi:ABC-type Fe3+/spermidine/putrescine transport system ATPase subunit
MKTSTQTNTIAVDLKGVTLAYGAFVAVKEVSLAIEKGSFVTLLGPSGCGKTTILRSIAGLVNPTGGDITIAGRRINDVPIHQRNIGLVFQNYALFPHKTVFDNIAFGLKYRKVAKSLIVEKVARALDMVRLPGVAKKLPSELSGGQQQRIALARAIVIEPDVLLLDEPLSALDANLREEMRTELKLIQRKIGITTIFVTHDQGEALAMSDLVVVMNAGRIEQRGAPSEVYEHPASEFVANFLGNANFLDGKVLSVAGGEIRLQLAGGASMAVRGGAVHSVSVGDKVRAVVRAEKIAVIHADGVPEANAGLTGRIVDVDYLGALARYDIELADGQRLRALSSLRERAHAAGEAVRLAIAPEHCRIL